MTQPTYEIVFAAPAGRDFIEIINWSSEQFGPLATDRYEALIGQALIDVGDNPFRPGTRQHPNLPKSVYTYHLASSRDRISGDRVKTPRHFLLYRIIAFRVEVLRILHDSRDLAQHVPEAW